MLEQLSPSLPEQCVVSLRRAIASAHPSWHPSICQGLRVMHQRDPAYLPALFSSDFLPNDDRLFAAFVLPLTDVRYVLVGEGPYPRADSATGVCFMDGAVKELWSTEVGGGLSKKVNRATSLRNFIKMLLVARGRLSASDTGKDALAQVSLEARALNSGMIQTLAELQGNFLRQGFLLLNSSLVFRPEVAPVKDAKAWQPFMQEIFKVLLIEHTVSISTQVRLVLWGKIAVQLQQIGCVAQFSQITSEHPYNLSFISNLTMQEFFAPMDLLKSTNECNEM
jgi:uracil-DNA glycosylase